MTKRRKTRSRSRSRKVSLSAARADLLARKKASRKLLRAHYDAAQTTDDNYRHWAVAGNLSPHDEADEWVRQTLRNRARYEVRNNSYAKGMVLTLANDTIGQGPKLKMMWNDGDGEAAERIELAFHAWAHNIRLPQKLRTMRMARCQDGEAFAVFTTNPKIPGRIQLDLRLIEADRIASPDAFFGTIAVIPDDLGNVTLLEQDPIEGIVYDADGNPEEYHILKNYPGDLAFIPDPSAIDKVDASQVIHMYRSDRPGQRRGVPEITPALPLYANLRRYTQAVIAAAETAADIAGVVRSNFADMGEATEAEPFDTIEVEKRFLLTLPNGYDVSQFKAEQPTTTYGDFKKEIINEIARCLNMPFNVAAGNSAQYNYASGRLDHQMYFKAIDVDRGDIEAVVLDPIFVAFMNEAILIEGLVPPSLRNPETWQHKWVWPGREHVDPVKEASAQDIRLKNGMTTYEEEKAREGGDYWPMFRQQSMEMQERQKFGLPLISPSPAPSEPLEEVEE